MVEPKIVVDGINVLYKCPYCPCFFCTMADFRIHLKAFGSVWAVHAWYFVGIHAFDPPLTRREKSVGFAQMRF